VRDLRIAGTREIINAPPTHHDMPKYWMVTDRAFTKGVPTGDVGPLSYWVSDNEALDQIANWTSVGAAGFQKQLVAAADAFPDVTQAENDKQKHVCFLIHGYNNGFDSAANLYHGLCQSLFAGPESLGLCISLDWPSLGSILGYEPDRGHAQECAGDVASVFNALHQWLLKKQRQTADDAANACKAKISIIAHSMGNYVTQKALSAVWKRNNQPLSVSLINQLIMVAADVDNDLFDASGEDANDGVAVANLSYRVTAMYSGRDNVLGASAGLKHFGTRRLGRSGLANRPPIEADGTKWDNIWDVDCSSFFGKDVGGMSIHGAYFITQGTLDLMRGVLQGTDRTVLDTLGLTAGKAWP
jgi:esterase/lipase superfamily enzyme